MTQIKICGLSTPETVDAAVDAGATHIGFVHHEPSPRHVSLEDAAKLRARVPAQTKVVLLTVALQPAGMEHAYRTVRPDIIQFHGGETVQWMAMVGKRMPMPSKKPLKDTVVTIGKMPSMRHWA